MTIQQLDHLNLTVSDLEQTIDWYSRIFGFRVVERGLRGNTPWAIIRAGEAMLCIYEDTEREPPSRFRVGDTDRHAIYHWGLRITDEDAWLKTVEENDLTLEFGGRSDYPHSTSWYVADPTGYSIEVVLWNEDRIAFDDDLQNETPLTALAS
ncbi:MAG: VOC family protein [Myxococcota bacterium]|nr:VOC family protein [Myxococcota bacterium]